MGLSDAALVPVISVGIGTRCQEGEEGGGGMVSEGR